MKFMVSAKHWQIFLIVIMLGIFVYDFLGIILAWQFWLFSIVTLSAKKLGVKPRLFNYSIVISVISAICHSVFLYKGFYDESNKWKVITSTNDLVFFLANTYNLFFATKIFVSVKEIELRDECKSNKVLVFIELLTFVFGIWFIQPKINKALG